MTAYQLHILLRFLNENTRIWHVVFLENKADKVIKNYHKQLRSYKYKISTK